MVSAADSGHDGDMNVTRGVLGFHAAQATTQLSVCLVVPPYPGSR